MCQINHYIKEDIVKKLFYKLFLKILYVTHVFHSSTKKEKCYAATNHGSVPFYHIFICMYLPILIN